MTEPDRNNLTVTGTVLALLCTSQSLPIGEPLTAVERVTDAEGNLTNQIDIGLSFMRSPYRITVERVSKDMSAQEFATSFFERGVAPAVLTVGDTMMEFLLARITEDETVARAAIADDGGSDEGFSNQYDSLVGTHRRPLDFVPRVAEDAARLIVRFAVPARVLAECEAKRRIVEDYTDHCVTYRDAPSQFGEGQRHGLLLALARLVDVYADHPDYRQEWQP